MRFAAAEPRPAAPGLEFVQRRAEDGAESAQLFIVSFAAKTHTFAVMDNPDGAFDTASAADKRGALAAVNGGYFHPDRTPLGLVIRQGVQIHPLEKARLLSGLVVVTDGGIALRRTAEFKPSAAPLLQQALGRRPNARMFELLQLYQMGVATLEELLAGLRSEADRMDARLAARRKNS